MANFRMSENARTKFVETVDIGGTNVTSGYVSMKDMDRVFAEVFLGTITDPVTTFQLLQAQSSAGLNAKPLTTSGAGATYQYNSSSPALTTAGQTGVLEARSMDLDVDGKFDYVAVYIAIAANNATDNVTAVIHAHDAAVQRSEIDGCTFYASADPS